MSKFKLLLTMIVLCLADADFPAHADGWGLEILKDAAGFGNLFNRGVPPDLAPQPIPLQPETVRQPAPGGSLPGSNAGRSPTFDSKQYDNSVDGGGLGGRVLKDLAASGNLLNPGVPADLAPQRIPLEPYTVKQPAPVAAPPPSDGTYISPFDGKRYDSYGNEITPNVQLPPAPTTCNPCAPVKLNPNLKDIVTLSPPATAPVAAASTSQQALVTNPYKYQSASTFGPPQNKTDPTAQTPPRQVNWAYQQIQLIGQDLSASVAARVVALRGAGIGQRYNVGGISLSKAAAERMALDIDIESMTYRDGQIVLSGAQSRATSIDAALFLTSIRLACSSNDPFFSLDPVNGRVWDEQGREALSAAWKRIKDNYNQDPGRSGFAIETFSVKRRYPTLWTELEPRYPELRTRLVFQPAELKETRFGEILYKADVLLKELTSGVSVVQSDIPLRADNINGYIPSDQRRVARDMLTPDNLKEPWQWRGHRLWFDLLPQANSDTPTEYRGLETNIDASQRPNLYSILRQRGFVGARPPNVVRADTLSNSDGVVDVSEVYPKMFVRRHDHSTGQDIGGAGPDLDFLSGDVNERISLYVNTYPELRDLTDVFRSYVASVKLVQQNARICAAVRGIPLSDSEKVKTPLPEFHPSELFITVAQYSWAKDGKRGWLVQSGSSINGGIALRGKEFSAAASVDRETTIISHVKQDLAFGVPAPTWQSPSGRRYIAFNLDPREPPARVPVVAETSVK